MGKATKEPTVSRKDFNKVAEIFSSVLSELIPKKHKQLPYIKVLMNLMHLHVNPHYFRKLSAEDQELLTSVLASINKAHAKAKEDLIKAVTKEIQKEKKNAKD